MRRVLAPLPMLVELARMAPDRVVRIGLRGVGLGDPVHRLAHGS